MLQRSGPFLEIRNGGSLYLWELIVGPTVKVASVSTLANSSPSLEEEWDASGKALISNAANPLWLKRSCPISALTADDDPVDALQVDSSDVFQQRLNREKTGLGGCLTKVLDPRQPVLAIFDTDSPLDVRFAGRLSEFGPEQLGQA
jgi:hypothetical protein